MVRCRACRAPKWARDICPNASCPRRMREWRPLRGASKPVTAMVQHGYHAEYIMRREVTR